MKNEITSQKEIIESLATGAKVGVENSSLDELKKRVYKRVLKNSPLVKTSKSMYILYTDKL